jgi:agmatine/peptidylarginine deiminase
MYLIEDIQDAGAHANDWQQTLVQLEAYMTAEGHTYEVFQSAVPRKVMDRETMEPTEEDAVSDSYILCVYK